MSANHFGVGYARTVDELIVDWPTGLERATVVDLPTFRLGGQ